MIEYKVEEPSFFTKWLWFCAGADEQLLMQCPKSDHVKYQGLGGVVFATGILAFISGSYAFYTIFAPKTEIAIHESSKFGAHETTLFMSLVAGIVWSLIIFNIERFIVSSAGKGDGTDKVTWEEVGKASPRIIMGVIIAITLSKPLEIRVMQDEINAALAQRQLEEESKLNETAKSQIADKRQELLANIENIEQKLEAQDSVLETRRLEIVNQRKDVEREIEGIAGSGKAGMGPAARQKLENLAQLEDSLKDDRKKLDEKQVKFLQDKETYLKELNELDGGLTIRMSQNKAITDQMGGLCERIKLGHEISPSISYALMALLLMIEIGPIFFKMMLTTSAYDYLKQNQEMLMRARAGIEVMGDVRSKNPLDPRSEYEEIVHDRFLAVTKILEEEKLKMSLERELINDINRMYQDALRPELHNVIDEMIRTRLHHSDLSSSSSVRSRSPVSKPLESSRSPETSTTTISSPSVSVVSRTVPPLEEPTSDRPHMTTVETSVDSRTVSTESSVEEPVIDTPPIPESTISESSTDTTEVPKGTV